MKRLKPAAEPIPRKFQPGDRVKPSELAVKLGFKKRATVVAIKVYTVEVRMDGETDSHIYSPDYWSKEE